MPFALDDLGFVLSLLEIIVLLVGLIIYVIATYAIVKDTLLHVNFRMVLCIILFRSVLIPARRLPTLYWRVFLIGEDTVPFVKLYNDASMITSNLLCTSLLVLSMERLMYTYLKCCSRSGWIGSAAVLGMLLSSNALLFLLRRILANSVFPISFLIAAPIISFILLILVFGINLRRRNALEVASLDEKAEANRSMNAVRIFLPAMFTSSVLTMATGLVLFIQFLWIPEEHVGSAEKKLNNIFGLIAATDSLLTPLLVVVRHKYLKQIYLKRITKEIKQKGVTPEQHLNQFAAQWKVGV